jgi:hypothetical protein
MDLIIFPGKNTPLKRYKSYFKGFNIREIKDGDRPNVIMCHSLGIVTALEYCNEHKIFPRIVCIDGVNLTSHKISTNGFYICSFRPVERRFEDDRLCYKEFVYYHLPEQIRHYPYMDKEIRDIIVNKLCVKETNLLSLSPKKAYSYIAPGKWCRVSCQVIKEDPDNENEMVEFEWAIEGIIKSVDIMYNTIEIEFVDGAAQDGSEYNYRQAIWQDKCWVTCRDEDEVLELEEFLVKN